MCKRSTDWLPLARPQLAAWPATQACDKKENQTGTLPFAGQCPAY